MTAQGFTTNIVHADKAFGSEHGAVHKPVHNSVQFGFDTVEDLIGMFQGTLKGAYSYSRQGTPTTLEDVGRLDSVAMSTVDGSVSMRLTNGQGREAVLRHTPRYIADDLLTLKQAVLGGTGMCWLPDYMCEEELRSGELVRLLPDWSTPVGIVHAVFPSRRGMSPAVRSFLDFLGEYVPVCGEMQRRAAASGV